MKIGVIGNGYTMRADKVASSAVYIYRLLHKPTGKVYVGSTKHLNQRIHNHFHADSSLSTKKIQNGDRMKDWLVTIIRVFKKPPRMKKEEFDRGVLAAELLYTEREVKKRGRENVLNEKIMGYSRLKRVCQLQKCPRCGNDSLRSWYKKNHKDWEYVFKCNDCRGVVIYNHGAFINGKQHVIVWTDKNGIKRTKIRKQFNIPSSGKIKDPLIKKWNKQRLTRWWAK